MRNNVQASADDIDVVEVFAAIKRNFAKLVFASLLVGALSFVALTKMTPNYKTVAQLQFGGRAVVSQVGGTPLRGAVGADVLLKVDKEAVASQVAVIKSRDLALKLIKDLNLRENREFNSALNGGGFVGGLLQSIGLAGSNATISEDDRILQQYDKALNVHQGKDTRVISIEFSSRDPQLAARMANHLAQLYLSGRVTRTVRQSVNASSYLKPEIVKLQRQVQKAEAAVEEYRGQHNLFAGSAGGAGRNTDAASRGTLNNEQLSELTRELTRAQTAQGEADARAHTIRELMARGIADASPDVMRSPLIQRLQDQRVRAERQVAELSATLLPGHPRMRQLRADLNGLNRQLRGEVRKIVESLSKENTVAARRVASIRTSINRLKSQVRNSGGQRAKLAELQRGARAKRQQLEQLLARYQNALARQKFSAVPLEAELFSKARASTIPSLKRGPISALVMAGTFLLGLAFIVSKELLNGSRRGGGTSPHAGRRFNDRRMAVSDMDRRYQGPVSSHGQDHGLDHGLAPGGMSAAIAETAPAATPDLAMSDPAVPVPAAATLSTFGNADNDADAPSGPVAQRAATPSTARYSELAKIAAVASYLQERPRADIGCRVLVASQHDGKALASEQAIELAMRLGAKGSQVILLDWCPQGCGLASYLKQLSRPGLRELLLGTAGFEEVIKRLSGSQVHFIASGADQTPGELDVDADRLNLILDALDEAYDYIVVYGDQTVARELFRLIEGRFDVGVTIMDAHSEPAVTLDAPGVYLGFEVSDLDIVLCTNGASLSKPVSAAPTPSSATLTGPTFSGSTSPELGEAVS